LVQCGTIGVKNRRKFASKEGEKRGKKGSARYLTKDSRKKKKERVFIHRRGKGVHLVAAGKKKGEGGDKTNTSSRGGA